MKILIFILLSMPLCFAKVVLNHSQKQLLLTDLKPLWVLSSNQQENIFSGEVISVAHVTSKDKNQTLSAKVAGIHPRTCQKSLRKISLYENYHNYMSFIRESLYSDINQRLKLTIDHALLPFPMILDFTMERVKAPGAYSYHFTNGIFKDLRGKIHIFEIQNRCLYYMQAEWTGVSTGIPNIGVEAFSQTLSKLGLENLIRISTL